MEKSRRIKRLIQKIAILLAVILAIPNVPMVQNLGLGYTEVHADPEPISEKPLLKLGVGCDLSDDKKTATLTPWDYRQPDIPLSGGAIRYEFSLSIDEEEIPEDSWEFITDNESMENSYQWILPDKVKGKEFFVSAYYHDDNNYADERAIYPVDLETPVIKTVSEVTKTDEGYEFDIHLEKEENNEGAYYFYILTSYNDSESLTISADDIIDEVYNCCEEDYESNNTVYGYEMVPMESTDFTIVADGSDFEPGIFVFQIVIMDPSENVSNKVITAPFITSLELSSVDITASVNSDLTYTGEDQQPSVTLTVNDEYSDVEKELYYSKLNDAINNQKITYKFKRVKDKDSNDISNEEASSTVKEIGLYEIYAESTDEDLVIEDESLGTFNVIDANVSAPDKDPNLSVAVSDDLTSYIITVDPSPISGIVGKSIEYISNGDRIEYEFINGNREGKATEFYTNGDRIEFKYIKSLREGKAIEFFTNGDRIEFEYIKSLRNGNAIEYFVNGDRIEFKYIKNLREGKAVEYFINGDKIEFEYSKDKRNGKVIEYFINGNKLTYSFLNDIKQGDAILYFKNGENIKFKFKNDKKEGKAVQYFTNGDTLIFNYIDDKPKGKANKYNKDGQLIKEYENINDLF